MAIKLLTKTPEELTVQSEEIIIL